MWFTEILALSDKYPLSTIIILLVFFWIYKLFRFAIEETFKLFKLKNEQLQLKEQTITEITKNNYEMIEALKDYNDILKNISGKIWNIER